VQEASRARVRRGWGDERRLALEGCQAGVVSRMFSRWMRTAWK
jgi:hypothetical protein